MALGQVELKAEKTGEAVELVVVDDGCGIAPGQAARLFQPYFTTKKHGTGLGLFVTQKLVAEHGGTVSYEANPGGGSVFRVRLPVRPSDRKESAAVYPIANGTGSPYTLLE